MLSNNNFFKCFLIIILTFFISLGLLAYEQEVEKDIFFIFSGIEFSKIEFPEKDDPVFLKLFEDIGEEFISSNTDFLKVNLAEMKVSIYKKGLLVKEAPIVTKGNIDNWGGSATGLYNILSGNKSSFSIGSGVYMPYALHYYGKYYIHGIPYYPGGAKLSSSFSGGCLRLEDEDAEEIYGLTELNMPVLVIDKERDDYEYINREITEFPELSAKSYLIADLDSGYVFAEKDSSQLLPIASLTKLMTALVVVENVNLKRSILIEEKMLNGYGSTKGLESGKIFGVVELLYPLLIESSNDAAEIFSYFLGRERTIRLMNEKAKFILMNQTKFTDPSGFDPGNISTAKDLFYLARYILNNRPPILEITKGNKVRSFGDINFDIQKLWNKNIFINDPTFVGGKTGFIQESKCTALFIFRFSNQNGIERNIAIITLGARNSKVDTQKAYIWLLNNYFKGIEL